MTTPPPAIRAGDLVRYNDPSKGTEEMTVTQVSGQVALFGYVGSGGYSFGEAFIRDLHVTVPARQVAKIQQDRAQERLEATRRQNEEARQAAYAQQLADEEARAAASESTE